MRRLFAVLLLAMVACAPAIAERRWLIQTDDNKIIGGTDDDNVEAPDAAFATLVADSVIRMADPPGADGVIQAGGFWDGTTYTPPAGLIPVIDPTTDAGMVQVAAHKMMDTFDAAIASLSARTRQAWPAAEHGEGYRGYPLADHRGGAHRLERHADGSAEGKVYGGMCASWPDGVNGDVGQYVDAMGTVRPVPYRLQREVELGGPGGGPVYAYRWRRCLHRIRGRHQRGRCAVIV